MAWREPIRGGLPDPAWWALSGMERSRSFGNLTAPIPPLSHLFGIRLAQLSAGGMTVSMAASPWLAFPDGRIDPSVLIDTAMKGAVGTTVAGGIVHNSRTISVAYGKAATTESKVLIARARLLHTRRSLALTEAVVEDSEGRMVAHATGTSWMMPMDPPPPQRELLPVEPPSYETPDPPNRSLPPEYPWGGAGGLEETRRVIESGGVVPITELTGLRWIEASEGSSTTVLPATEWLCDGPRAVQNGVLAMQLSATLTGAAYSVMASGRGPAHVTLEATFLRQTPPDGRDLIGRAAVVHADDQVVVTSGEVLDADGNRVARGGATSIIVEVRERQAARGPVRTLTTVLFTDIVGSTDRAREIGDAHWSALLAQHHDLVRKQLEIFRGREVKTTGDGFLATFDSPALAVQSARGIRDAVKRLGLSITAGIHTGEVERIGKDIGGIAVHIASRVCDEAGAGDILVSSTVRDLVTGSGLRFSDRGTHKLKGVEGEWHLFTVEE